MALFSQCFHLSQLKIPNKIKKIKFRIEHANCTYILCNLLEKSNRQLLRPKLQSKRSHGCQYCWTRCKSLHPFLILNDGKNNKRGFRLESNTSCLLHFLSILQSICGTIDVKFSFCNQ